MNPARIFAMVIGAMLGTAAVPLTAEAQAPKVFFACYAPVSGLVYRIKEPGLPANCFTATHVQFSWTDHTNVFQITDPTSAQPALSASTAGIGPAGIFRMTKPDNFHTVALQVTTTGQAGAGYFEVNNTNSDDRALEVKTNGIEGIGVFSNPTGAASLAGYFVSSGPGGNGLVVGGSRLALEVEGFTQMNGDVRVNGNATVTGTLTKPAGSFRIDHPLDPEHKYLSHSFVESPDMMNVYNGNVTLDEGGRATVELPDYFQALNKDFRYQLTAMGAPGPDLYVAQAVDQNRFKIAGGRPYARVSWQVTGVRKDAYAEENRIRVETDKPQAEQRQIAHP